MGVIVRYDPARPPTAILAAVDLAQLQSQISLQTQPALATPTLFLNDNTNGLSGSPYVLRYIARLSTSGLYGCDAVESTLIDYFLDLSSLLNNKDTLNKYAQMIEEHLADKTFLVGQKISVADLYVFEMITSNTRWAHFAKTSSAQFPHLFRWFALVAGNDAVKTALQAKLQLDKKKAEVKMARSSEGAGFDVDLPGAEMGKVVTRFPPEPSGYLHIGHLKAAMLNDAIARKYNGKLVLRFDDTNPQKEKEEYVENIMADLARVGIKHDMLTHTSDYFDLILSYGRQMLEQGKAYVDNTPVDQMRKWRMDGVESPMRNAPLADHLRLWQAMIDGTPEGLECCVRAKIDMQAKNKAMRDPTIFRCNVGTPHHRTGNKYKCYPTYDFACPIVDSIEGVTHTLRTNEYRDRNEQYYWMIDALGLRKPFIRDYSRLNFVYTVLSKRKLQWFVDTKRVDGWYDARFPTIQGILRRGMTVEALREFILGQGFSMATNTMEWDKIWTINKRIIDPIAPRFTAISAENPALLVLEDVDGAQPEAVSVDLHPKNPSVGKKVVTRSNKIIIEQDDAKLIKEGEEVTIMSWGNIIVNKIISENGVVTRLEGKTNLSGDPKKTEKKLTWIDSHDQSVKDHVKLNLIEFDTLITVPKVEEGMDFDSIVNDKTRYDTPAIGEPAMRNLQKGDVIQIQRRGFFIVDSLATLGDDSSPIQLIFVPDGKMKAMSTLSTKVDKGKVFSTGAATAEKK